MSRASRSFLLVALALGLAACGFDTRSQEFACQVTADCAGGRICQAGWCVLFSSDDDDAGPDDDASTCPSVCSACAGGVCRVDCDHPGDCDTLVCPAGMPCEVSCTGTGSCDAIDCRDATACSIACTRAGTCDEVQCGDGPCTVTCDGADTCGSVDCADACSCEVTCEGDGACATDADCPAPVCEDPGGGCDPTDGAECSTCAG